MLISLVIPVYNKEKFISDAIDSVLQQSFKDIEIILVNDGSTDNSAVVCKKYADEYENVRYIEQMNKGVSSARNNGINNAKGKYIMFLDADDYWVKDAFNIQIEKLLQSDIDIVMCSSYVSNVDRDRYGIDLALRDMLVPGHQLFPLAGTFAACIYKLQMLKDNDIFFDEGIGITEDQTFKVKALYAANQIRMMSHFLYIYCNTPGSIMHTHQINQFERVEVWKLARSWFQQHGQKEHLPQIMQYIDAKISARTLLYAKLYVQSGHSKEEMVEELKRIEGYDMLMKATAEQVMPYQKEELYMFQSETDKFVKMARLEGLKLKIGRCALSFKSVRGYRDKKRYPIIEI